MRNTPPCRVLPRFEPAFARFCALLGSFALAKAYRGTSVSWASIVIVGTSLIMQHHAHSRVKHVIPQNWCSG